MRKMKRITAGFLVAAMLCGSFGPVTKVQADDGIDIVPTVTTEAEVSEPATELTTEATTELKATEGDDLVSTEAPKTTESVATTQTPSTAQVTTEATTTQQQTTEQTTTAQATTQQKTTEQATTASNLVATGLSPVKSKIIVLDPGHCEIHTGATANGLKEEVVVTDIAQACKDALNNYADVTVYMTREEGECCEKFGLGDCLLARNNYARYLDADFLISFHINAAGSTATGANVLAAYKSGYNDNVRKETQEFGNIVLSQLSAIGVANRGLMLRTSSVGNRYANGSLTDYYSIVRNGVWQNIPSVIIEHGFITSASDCSKFFKTVAKRKKLGKADAKAVISYYKLKNKVISGEFIDEEDGTYYKISGKKRATGWIKDDGKWYYFAKKTGKMKTGFITVGKNKFYLSPETGEMQVGWFTVKGSRYFAKGDGTIVKNCAYSDGTGYYLFNSAGKQLKKGLHSVNNETYYVGDDRQVKTGVVKVNGVYNLFDQSGKRLYGYQSVNGKYYYLDTETGEMTRKKIVTIDGSKYYFGSDGVRVTGFVTYKLKKYYFSKKTGKMLKGWRKISGKYYYFDKKTGVMQRSKWIGDYYVNILGVRTKKK